MRRALHDRPGGEDRVFGAADPGDGAGSAVAAVHDRGVHLVGAGGGRNGAAPGIEERVVFELDYRRRHRVERRAALGEDVAPGGERATEPGVVEWARGQDRTRRVAVSRRRRGSRGQTSVCLGLSWHVAIILLRMPPRAVLWLKWRQ